MAGRNLFADQPAQPKAGRNLFAQQPEAQPEQPAAEPSFIDKTLNAAGDIAQRQFAPLVKAAEFGATNPTAGLETGAAIASGIVAEPVAGLAGIAQSVNPFADEFAGARAVEATRDALTFQPRTEGAQELGQGLGEGIQKGIDAVNTPISGIGGLLELISGQGLDQAVKTIKGVQEQGVSEQLGDRTLEVTDSPLAASIAKTAPTAILTAFGVGPTVKTVKQLAKAAKNKKLFSGQSAFKQKIADDIAAGATDKRLAKFMVDGSGKVRTDRLAKEVIKQGYDEGVVAVIKGASKADKAKMSKMIGVVKKGKENALFAAQNRASDVAGSSLLDRVNHIKVVNRSAGKKLDVVAKSLKGKGGNFEKPINDFMSDLDDMGITIGDDLKPIFRGSDIEDLAGPQSAINNMVKRMARGTRGQKLDAFEVHRMKKFIDEQVTFGKAAEGLSGKTERILKNLRRNLDSSLDSQFPAYDKVNTRYSDTINALDSLQDVAGKKMDLFGPNANKATGTLLRRMMSNAQSRVNLVDSVDNLETIARKYGGRFNDDIATQMLFADELDSMFGAAAKTSLQGDVAKAVKSGGRAAQGRTVTDIAIEGAAAGAEKLRNINQEAAFKSMQALLK